MAGIEVEVEADAGGKSGVEDLGGLADCVGNVELLDEESAAAGIGKHLASQMGGALRGVFDFADKLRFGAEGGRSSARRLALPSTPVRMLLKSWAMPPARTPRLSNLWASRKRASVSRCSVMSVVAPTSG